MLIVYFLVFFFFSLLLCISLLLSLTLLCVRSMERTKNCSARIDKVNVIGSIFDLSCYWPFIFHSDALHLSPSSCSSFSPPFLFAPSWPKRHKSQWTRFHVEKVGYVSQVRKKIKYEITFKEKKAFHTNNSDCLLSIRFQSRSLGSSYPHRTHMCKMHIETLIL